MSEVKSNRSSRDLTDEEIAIAKQLGDVWNAFCKLPRQHCMEQTEFCTVIHQAQAIILARPTVRAEGWVHLR